MDSLVMEVPPLSLEPVIHVNEQINEFSVLLLFLIFLFSYYSTH